MLINFFTRKRKGGYVRDDRFNMLSFFSNNTLCLRREILHDTGKYDENIPCSEDVDICARIYLSKWQMYHSPFMKLQHRARPDLISLLRQWWRYGYYSVVVYLKYNPGIFELYRFSAPEKLDVFKEYMYFKLLLFKKGKPFSIFVVLNNFLLMHLLAFLSVILLLTGRRKVAAITAIGAVHQFRGYITGDISQLDRIGRKKTFFLVILRYLVNLSFFTGSQTAGLTRKALYFSHIIWAPSNHLMDALRLSR